MTKITYADALRDVRRQAFDGVTDAIRDSRPIIRPRSKKQRFEAHQSMFDGIIDALVYSIIIHANPGHETILAQLVAGNLVSRVAQQSSSGRG